MDQRSKFGASKLSQEARSLKFAMDEDNDYESSVEKGNGFIHALQL